MKNPKRIAAISCAVLNLILDALAVHCWVELGCERLSSLYYIWAIIAIGCAAMYIIAKTAIEWWQAYKQDLYYKS